jgi:predicted ATPase
MPDPSDPDLVTSASEPGALAERLAATGLLALTGPGGMGKSHLADRIARAAGLPVHRADLSLCRDSAQVPAAVAEALHVAPGKDTDPLPELVRLLAPQRCLLILDTCERVHIGCARLAGLLRDACPGLQILATSCRALTVPGGLLVRVGSLDLEQSARLLQAESAAQGVTPTGPWAVLLAQRLDGDPLSILLAARALQRMDPRELFVHLSALGGHLSVLTGGPLQPVRHRTLLRAVEWSHSLCDRRQQLLWAGLSGFDGAFTRDHVQLLFGVGDAFDALIDASIVLPTGKGRYRLPVAHREYGQRRLIDPNGPTGDGPDS